MAPLIERRSLPGLDKPISRLVLGSMVISEDRPKESAEVLSAFWECGGNAVDTAHIYGGGRCSRMLGQWLESEGLRDDAVILDKGCHPDKQSRFTPEDLQHELMANLAWLRTDHVDLWVFHRDDPSKPLEPIVKALNGHHSAGRVGAFGGSNWSIDRIQEFNAIAAELGLKGMSLNNPNLSLATVNEPMWRDCVTADASMRSWHEQTQFPLFSWSSMGGGWFAKIESDDVNRVYRNHENVARRDRAETLARRYGLSAPQIALAWTLNQPFPVWALVGCRNRDEVHQAAEASRLSLSAEELRWLEFGGDQPF